MYYADSQTDAVAASIVDAQCSPILRTNIVDDEPNWRVPRQSSAMASSGLKVVATRWHADDEQTQEFGAETPVHCHVVKIVLRKMNIRFTVSGLTVQDGVTTPWHGPCHRPRRAGSLPVSWAIRCLAPARTQQSDRRMCPRHDRPSGAGSLLEGRSKKRHNGRFAGARAT